MIPKELLQSTPEISLQTGLNQVKPTPNRVKSAAFYALTALSSALGFGFPSSQKLAARRCLYSTFYSPSNQ
jgi:hypothetical protein